jgi:hypothetical protein
MLVYSKLLKRDYKITYTLALREDAINYGKVYTTIMKDCRSHYDAYYKWDDSMTEWYDWNEVEVIRPTKQQRVNEEVYELVLADLFEGHIGIYEYVDTHITTDEDQEIDEQLEGLERMMIEHEAYNKYMNSK